MINPVLLFLLLLLLIYASLPSVTYAFAPRNGPLVGFSPCVRPPYPLEQNGNSNSNSNARYSIGHITQTPKVLLALSNKDNENRDEERTQQDRLTQLGFSSQEIDPSTTKSPFEPQKVLVTEVNVDPVTLVAIGFGLIAFNFLVFANLGDGGIGGIVARIINTWGQ